MSSISTSEKNILISACGMGALEAAHMKAVLDAIDAAQVYGTTTHLHAAAFRQLRSNGILGEEEAELLQTAITAAAAGTPIANNDDTAALTRAAMRKLRGWLPQSTIEGLVAVIFT